MLKIINEISIAIISDLHCAASKKGNFVTYLYCDTLRTPKLHHPIEALKILIDQLDLKSDMLLCPGDLTDKIDIIGLNSGWGFVEEIGRKLDCEDNIIASIGNHDFDSHNFHKAFSEPDYQIKNLKDNFPFKGDTSKFWTDHFEIISNNGLSVLNLNTVYSHSKEEKTILGESLGFISKIDEIVIEKIKKELSVIPVNNFKIALLHHHPTLYSDTNLTSYSDKDVLQGGDVLLEVLKENRFDIVVHGHKHVPRFNVFDNLPVFCAGSFSSLMNLQESNSKNTFHLLKLKNLEKDGDSIIKVGELFTWEFRKGIGWDKPLDRKPILKHRIGFGLKVDISDFVKKVNDFLDKKNINLISIQKLFSEFEELNYLNPSDINLFFEGIKHISNFEISTKEDGSLILVKE